MAIQDKFNKANHIYKITLDIDLEGGTLTIPANCTLDFLGGSLSNGYAVFNGYCKVIGSGWKLKLPKTSINVEGLVAYVDTINGRNNATGTKDDPFKLVNDALQYFNYIKIRGGNFIRTIEELKFQIETLNVSKEKATAIINCITNTTITNYDNAALATICGHFILVNPIWTNESDIWTIDLKKANYKDVANIQFVYEDLHPNVFKIGHIDNLNSNVIQCHKAKKEYIQNRMDFCVNDILDINDEDYAKLSIKANNVTYLTVLSPKIVGIRGNGYQLNISNLKIYDCNYGIASCGSRSIIENCVIYNIGGSLFKYTQSEDKAVLAGNAIESYGNYSNIIVRNNNFYNIYDSAITLLGTGSNGRIEVYNNSISNAYCGFESWGHNSINAIIVNNRFVNVGNNKCIYKRAINSSDSEVPDTGFAGSISMYNQTLNNVRVFNNTHLNCDCYFLESMALTINNEMIYAKSDNRIVKIHESTWNSYKISTSYSKKEVKKSIETALSKLSGKSNHIFFDYSDIINSTNDRPSLTQSDKGFQHFDITLNKPIWWTGAKWVDATGTEV